MENMGLNRTRNRKISKITFLQTNSPFRKLKFFLPKVSPQSRRRQGGHAEFNSLLNCEKFRWRICVSTAEETEKQGRFYFGGRIQLSQN